MKKNVLFISFVVSLGGFLFGFDAGIISGVMSYVGPEFNLNDIQTGWVVSSPSFAAMIAMLVAGRLSDLIGRKKILIVVAFVRELFGSGELWGVPVIPQFVYDLGYQDNGLMLLSPMALIVVGVYIWIQRYYNRKLIEKD